MVANQHGFFVKPIRSSVNNIGSLNGLKYNTTTGEIFFDTNPNTIAVDTITPSTSNVVTIDADLIVTGTSTLAGLATFDSGIRTNTITPASDTSITLGEGNTVVTIPGQLLVRGNTTELIFDSFQRGIETNIILPVSGTTITLGNTSTTVSVPGALDVTGTATYAGVATFNAGIRTDTITPTTALSVNIPGSGSNSLQIGVNGQCLHLLIGCLYCLDNVSNIFLPPQIKTAQVTGGYGVGVGASGRSRARIYGYSRLN